MPVPLLRYFTPCRKLHDKQIGPATTLNMSISSYTLESSSCFVLAFVGMAADLGQLSIDITLLEIGYIIPVLQTGSADYLQQDLVLSTCHFA